MLTGTPISPEAGLFYRSALQRFGDAEVLLGEGRAAGAVYLAGHGVECILKSLIIVATPAPQRPAVVGTFRGRVAHDYEWLRGEYAARSGPPFPATVNRQFTFVGRWSTELRCSPRSIPKRDAALLLAAAAAVTAWAGRGL